MDVEQMGIYRDMTTGVGLERYREISILGRGGMATVTLAEDTLLGRPVALKRLSATAEDGSDAAFELAQGVSRLRREALLGAKLNHPNLVSIYDIVATDEGDVVLVMEYVAGETLLQRLRRSGRLGPVEAVGLLEGVAAGLDVIHQHGIVHRDLKPANVLLGEDGAVKLADFGIAIHLDITRVTNAGDVMGTFRYMAPEQLENAELTPAVDIYALAALAYEMLSGEKARAETNPLALAHAITTAPPPDLRSSWPDAPPAAAAVLATAMSHDPSARPTSAGQFVARLRRALLTREPPARRLAERPARPARPMSGAVAAAAAAPAALAPATLARAAGSDARTRIPRRPATGHRPPPSRTAGPARRRWPLLAAGLAIAALAIILLTVRPSDSRRGQSTPVAALGQSGGSGHRDRGRHGTGARPTTGPVAAAAPATGGAAGAVAAGTSTGAGAPGTGTATGAGSPPSPTPSPSPQSTAGAGGPAATVERFYHLAAAQQLSAAWALADPALRAQLQGFASFAAGQAGDRSVTFHSIQTTARTPDSATVALTTTSVHTNGTVHCTGTVDLARAAAGSGAGWLLHQVHISCG